MLPTYLIFDLPSGHFPRGFNENSLCIVSLQVRNLNDLGDSKETQSSGVDAMLVTDCTMRIRLYNRVSSDSLVFKSI